MLHAVCFDSDGCLFVGERWRTRERSSGFRFHQSLLGEKSIFALIGSCGDESVLRLTLFLLQEANDCFLVEESRSGIAFLHCKFLLRWFSLVACTSLITSLQR